MRAAQTHTLPLADPMEAQVHVVREAEDYLAQVQQRLRCRGLTRIETAVWYGPAAEAIVDAARVREADLIVMSTHGRSGIGRLVLGSTAEQVLRSTRTPILLVRHPEAPLDRSAGAAQRQEVSSV